MNNRIKNLIIIFSFTFLILLFLPTISNASLYLNNLDFNCEIDENGNMKVVETWNIDVSDTNTLYKTFKLDSSKYSGITDVTVQEVGKGNLTKHSSWAYHLPTGTYYGGLNNDRDFEICWGVGLDNGSATKTYKISYTFLDCVSKYNDCAELYCQLIGPDFEINAKKITGTIKLPRKASSVENIKVWGHIETLNGEIYAVSNDTVQFTIDNYKGKNYVEVRIAMPEDMILNTSRVYNKNHLDEIIAEETAWADAANARRKRNELITKIIGIAGVAVSAIIGTFFIYKTIKYIRILKNTQKLKPTMELDYYREKPEKNSTPGDALFLYNKGVNPSYTTFGNVFSATLLNLNLKKYFNIEVSKNEKGKDEVKISKTEKSIEELSYEEEKIARFVSNAIGNKENITIKELQKYIKNHPSAVSTLIEKTGNLIKTKNTSEKKYDEKTAKEKDKYTTFAIIYFIIGFMLFIVFPLSIPFIINGILAILINRKLSRLTQKGIDESEQWKGLKKYMEDFSLLNEKEVPAIEVWEEFLVYATVFGIADKVIKQLKLVYPNFDEMSSMNTSSYVYLMSNTNFNSSFSSAINSSISSTMSSGSGGGGGFSGGGGGGFGGGRRRPDANIYLMNSEE